MYLEINVNLYNYNSYIRYPIHTRKKIAHTRSNWCTFGFLGLWYRTVRDLLTSLQIQQHVQVNNLANISSNFFYLRY